MNKRFGIWSVFSVMILLVWACSEKDGEEEGVEVEEVQVLEYCPAPGQFINERFDCKTGVEAAAWAQERLRKGYFVSLGSFGGYLSVKMPEVVKNRSGYDFSITGNPLDSSSEPGIVWVAEDVNGNGVADDPWYELKGSEVTVKDYEVTYDRPASVGHIRWRDNKGQEGVINYLPEFHAQMYYPAWITKDSYSLRGSMLTPRVAEEGNIWQVQAFGHGYADNLGSDMEKRAGGHYLYNRFDLDDAVDREEKSVALTQIHFVKIQCAVLANVPAVGEVSTEVLGFTVLK